MKFKYYYSMKSLILNLCAFLKHGLPQKSVSYTTGIDTPLYKLTRC